MKSTSFVPGYIAAALCMTATHTLAAEHFAVRYNMVGSLGAEIFAPQVNGLVAGAVYTDVSAKKISGPNGDVLTTNVPGGVVPLPAPTPSSLYPTYGPSVGTVDHRLDVKIGNLGLGYLTKPVYADGQFLLAFNVPYVVKRQSTAVRSATPPLTFDPAIPAGTQAVVTDQFNTAFQSQLAAGGSAASGEIRGFGDVEVGVGWRVANEQYKFLANFAVAMPTGKYDSSAGPDAGYGNFYTFRPEIACTYMFRDDIALAGKVTLGVNTRNRDNQWRSGNWLGLEVAAGHATSFGVIGVQSVHVQQIQDDSGTEYGTNRLKSTNAGIFATTLLPVVEVELTLQYMRAMSSRNALDARYLQLRMIKAF